MGGDIWVNSELGQGSTFHFTVELQVQKQAAESPSVGWKHPWDAGIAGR